MCKSRRDLFSIDTLIGFCAIPDVENIDMEICWRGEVVSCVVIRHSIHDIYRGTEHGTVRHGRVT